MREIAFLRRLISLVLVCSAWTSLGMSTPPRSSNGKMKSPSTMGALWNSKKVSARLHTIELLGEKMEPIFEEHQKTGTSPYRSKAWRRFSRACQDLCEDNSPEGDVALVQALSRGTHTDHGDGRMCHIIKRGKRMLPLLNFALKNPVRPDGQIANVAEIKECIRFIGTHAENFKVNCD